jgi:Cu/Ag efflux protein CusF
MIRQTLSSLVALLVFSASLLAQDGIQRGTVKKVDADKRVITVTADGKDLELTANDETRFMNASGQQVKDGLKNGDIKAGEAVMFKYVEQDGKKILVGLRIGVNTPPNAGGGPGGEIRRAKIKKLDIDKLAITLTVGEKDMEFALAANTQVLDAKGETLKDKLNGFKEGSPIFFRSGKRDGKDTVVAMKLDDGKGPQGPGGPPQLVKVDTSKFKPLTDLGTEKYQGFEGGQYPGGKNERPAEHEAAGLALAKEVQPLDADGKPSPNGKIVLLSVGMSNTAQSSGGFQRQLTGFSDVNPRFQFVNGAQGGMTAFKIQDADEGQGATYWTRVDVMLKAAGVSRAQVQAIWIKQADAGPSEGFPGYAKKLQGELAKVVQIFPSRFPNCKLVYLSSRTYGGYAKTPLNPEPYAYESGFSVKWLIEQQIKGEPSLNYDPKKGPVKAPWLSWGPYLWANGSAKRADGFSYTEGDFSPSDGTHQSNTGTEKVGKLMLDFFKSDSTTKPWFLKSDVK